ncbi:translation factor pelota [Ophiostoma piceae UAMH 11346]|uniref:Protein DOM34 homolog n=1 Tax=Ophiostoma piceae (strain UAMH 11346) TaxID=1262450 RepID=S3BZB9_OPHP1|nr:translation factor pelota [Ophiostoma piceae UAMH 11346]
MKFAGKKQEVEIAAINSLGELGVALLPVEPEDMWHANNLIRPGDTIKAAAVRKVIAESATGSTTSSRVHANLTIRVTSTFFDPPQSSLQVSGTVVSENAITNLGQYHTLDLELHRAFTLWKKNGWDSVALEELKESLRDDKSSAIAAVVMSDSHANVCLITEFQTLVKYRIEGNIPKKLTSSSTIESKTNKFFDNVLLALLDTADFSDSRLLILASPGYTAHNFRMYLMSTAARTGDTKLRRMGTEAVVVHSSTGNTHSLNEALNSPEVAERLKNAKFRSESKLMDDLLEKLRSENEGVSARASYGAVPVTYAVDEGAVGRGGGVLLINNALFRSEDVSTRKRFVAIVDKVKEAGGEVRLLSSDHESGQRLDGLGGIAALLTYPLQYRDESDDEEPSVRMAVGEDDRDMVV